jgi:hypothetical protein
VNSGTRVGGGGCGRHIKDLEGDDKEHAGVSLGQWRGGWNDHKNLLYFYYIHSLVEGGLSCVRYVGSLLHHCIVIIYCPHHQTASNAGHYHHRICCPHTSTLHPLLPPYWLLVTNHPPLTHCHKNMPSSSPHTYSNRGWHPSLSRLPLPQRPP